MRKMILNTLFMISQSEIKSKYKNLLTISNKYQVVNE